MNECWSNNAIKVSFYGTKVCVVLQMHNPFVVLFSPDINFSRGCPQFCPKAFLFITVNAVFPSLLSTTSLPKFLVRISERTPLMVSAE